MTKQLIKKNFIVFEGIDGASKTTQICLVSQILEKYGIKAATTYEPSDGKTGQLIRHLLNTVTLDTITNNDDSYIFNRKLSYLFAADRDEHIYKNDDGILALLKSNEVVICDRYLFSSIAYQGDNQKTMDLSTELNKNFPLPEILVYFDLSPEEAMKRIPTQKKDIMETLSNLRSVYKRYDTILQKYENIINITKIDATSSRKIITEQVVQLILNTINNPTQ